MGHRVIPLASRRLLDFSNLAVGGAETLDLAAPVLVAEFGDGVLEVKVHAVNLGGAATLAIVVRLCSLSPEDPDVQFLGDAAATITLDAGTSAPSLQVEGLAPGFGAYLQVQVVATQDSTARPIEATVSVDLVMRAQVAPKPQVQGDFLLASASPTLTVGDGTGSPTVALDKSATGTAALDLRDRGTTRFRVALGASEELYVARLNASGVEQDRATVDPTSGDWTFPADLVVEGTKLTLASTADASATLQAHTSNSGVFALHAGNAVAADRAALKHDHSAAAWLVRIAGADTYRADASNLYPLVTGRDLGKSSDRWDEVFCETLDVDTEIAGRVRDYTDHCFNYTGTAKVYLPMQGSTSEATSISYLTTRLAPFDGQLLAVLVYTSSSGGTTVVGFHKNGNTTATETDSQTQGSGATVTYTFSSSTFSKGDRLHVSLDATNAVGDVNVCCVWEYDTRT